jgi:pimeloyl-ACP methyl ester carboxylesterase
VRRLLFLALVLLGALLAVNTVVTDNETKGAKADLGRIVDQEGGALQVREDGPAGRSALVLLHGFAASMHWWQPAAQRLAGRFRVIRLDLLGHGGSQKPKSGYSMENQARLVDTALAQAGIRRAVIVGHSLGGVVATALAERDPALVQRLVLVGTPPEEEAGELPFLARLGFVPVIGEAIRRVVPDGVVRDNLEHAFASGFDVPDQFVEDYRKMTYRSYDSSHHESGDFQEARPVDERLSAARKPLLVIFGREDDIVDPDSASDFRQVPGARVEYLPDAGHSPMYEKPDEVSRLIANFAFASQRSGANRRR